MEYGRILGYSDVLVAAVLLLKIYFGGARRKTTAEGRGTNSDSSTSCILMVTMLASSVEKLYATPVFCRVVRV